MRYLVGTGSNPHLRPIASAARLQAVGTDGCLAGCKRLGTRHLFPFPVHAGSLATHHGWPGDQTTARIVQKLWSRDSVPTYLVIPQYWLWWLRPWTLKHQQLVKWEQPLPRPPNAPKRSCSLRWRHERPRNRSWDGWNGEWWISNQFQGEWAIMYIIMSIYIVYYV
jgi:hypothetical protein